MPKIYIAPTPESTKQCYCCRQFKTLDQFLRVKGRNKGTDRIYSYCKECDNQKQRTRHRKKRGDAFREPPPKPPTDDVRWCPQCKTFKPFDAFHANTKARSGLASACRECCRPSIRKHYLKRQYGLTEDDYEIMLHEQNDTCAICKKPETVIHMGKVPNLSVDHCHATGAIRGLLCYRCNHLVGFIERFGSEGLDAATVYLAQRSAIKGDNDQP